ncbi:MAG TPA: hypothetical protein DER23_03110 [Clostridiales bacterium]|nr:hypothetical protein [Clostridiales bacterium]HCG35313.1 hypothetical protein [Clostridiales bacterium]
MFDFIYNFFGWIIRSFYELFKGTSLAYALALLMFAIIIKIVLFPLGIKQQKNMQKQARLRPRETAIRKKYAGREDQATKQKMQNEVMEMYKEERFNPASGCLPLLIQLPLLIMLYAVVRGPLTYIAQFGASELAVLGKALGPLFNVSTYSIDTSNEIVAISVLRENSTFLTGEAAELIKKLPDLTLFGLDLTATPTFASWLVIIPVLNLLASFFGQSLIRKMSYQPLTETENNAGCSPKMMNIMMPLFSTYIAFQVPAALGLYWIYTNLLGVIQQYILKKMYPTPVFTEEELKAAEKLYAAAAKNKGSGGNKLPPKKKNSLVYDDDDDIPAPAVKKSGKSLLDDDTGSEQIKKNKTSKEELPIEKAPLKDDKE